MVEPIRTAVAAICSQLKKKLPISRVFENPTLASMIPYLDVVVESAGVDKMKGLVFRLRFPQPAKLQSLTSKKRIESWENIRSLERESLLGLLSDEPDFKGFLLVNEKDIKLLGKDKNWSRIEVSVPNGNNSVQDFLLFSAGKYKAKHSLMFVEFRGILFEAYQLVLQNLQFLSRRALLPFSKYLAPTMSERQLFTSDNRILPVDPPSYVPQRFSFDLAPLKTNRHSIGRLFLPSNASYEDDRLLAKVDAETVLDAGQCKGLVAALTQEFALIQGTTSPVNRTDEQGPPGTGKTYLGVQLVKTLLHNKRVLRLGPIICV